MARKRRTDVGGVVDGPAQRERSFFRGEDAGDDRSDGGAVLRGGNVEDDVFAAFDVDDFAIMEDRFPVRRSGSGIGRWSPTMRMCSM